VHVVKGEHRAAYSGFDGHVADVTTTLEALLRHAGVVEVDVVGLADSHCVKATAIDAAGAGFATTVLTDLTAGVSPETTDAAVTEMTRRGVRRRRSDLG
jgi:nicotinamidase/pyrazinamidase